MAITGQQMLASEGGRVDADLFEDLTRIQLEDRLDKYAASGNTAAAALLEPLRDTAALHWAYRRVWDAKATDLAKRNAQQSVDAGAVSRTISAEQIKHFRELAKQDLDAFDALVLQSEASVPADAFGRASQSVEFTPLW